MKVKTNQTFKDLDGNIVGQIYEGPVLKEGTTDEFVMSGDRPAITVIDRGADKALTLKQVVCQALMTKEVKDNKPVELTEAERWTNFQLTRKIQDKSEVDLTPSEIVLILKRVHLFRPDYIYGQVREMLQ